MKKIQISDIEIGVYEGDDIPYVRFAAFKKWLPQIFYGFDVQLFSRTKQKYMEAVSAGRHAEGVILWENFEQSILLSQPNADAWGMCFALITVMDGEAPDLSESQLIDKLTILMKKGITQQQIESEVETFMKALPQIWTLYTTLKARQLQTDRLLSILG